MANTKTEVRVDREVGVFGRLQTKATTSDDKGNSHTATNTDRDKAIKGHQDHGRRSKRLATG